MDAGSDEELCSMTFIASGLFSVLPENIADNRDCLILQFCLILMNKMNRMLKYENNSIQCPFYADLNDSLRSGEKR